MCVFVCFFQLLPFGEIVGKFNGKENSWTQNQKSRKKRKNINVMLVGFEPATASWKPRALTIEAISLDVKG